MELLAFLDFLFGLGKHRAPLTALLRSPHHVLSACGTTMKDESMVLDVMTQCDDNAHTVSGSVDKCKQQEENVTYVIKGAHIMAIETKPSTLVTGNVLLPSHKTPSSVTTTQPMDTLLCIEFNHLICHLIISFFYNMSVSSIYVMEDQVIDIKLISCTALPCVHPSADTTRDHVVLLVEMRDGNSYVLDPSFMALDPSGSYERPYGIFRTDDRELNKWYKHMEFAIDYCSYTSMIVLYEYEGIANLLKMIDDEFDSSLCTTALQAFNKTLLPTRIVEKKKKREKKTDKTEKTLKIVKKSINIQRMIEDFEKETSEEKQLSDSLAMMA